MRILRVVTVRESQGEKCLFYTDQEKSGNLKKGQGRNSKYPITREGKFPKFCGNLLCWVYLIFSGGVGCGGREVRLFFGLKPSVTNRLNSKIVDVIIICFMHVC